MSSAGWHLGFLVKRNPSCPSCDSLGPAAFRATSCPCCVSGLNKGDSGPCHGCSASLLIADPGLPATAQHPCTGWGPRRNGAGARSALPGPADPRPGRLSSKMQGGLATSGPGVQLGPTGTSPLGAPMGQSQAACLEVGKVKARAPGMVSRERRLLAPTRLLSEDGPWLALPFDPFQSEGKGISHGPCETQSVSSAAGGWGRKWRKTISQASPPSAGQSPGPAVLISSQNRAGRSPGIRVPGSRYHAEPSPKH